MGLLSDIGDFLFGWMMPDMDQPAIGVQVTKPASDDAIKVVYGQRKVSGTIVFKGVEDSDQDDTPNDTLHIVIVWSEAVTSIDDLYLDDYSYKDKRFEYKDGGKLAQAVHFPNGMGDYSDPYLKAAGFDPASLNHRLDGCAVSYVRLERIAGEDNPFNGEPSITALVTGRQVERLTGGTGKHASTNHAECLYDYLTNKIYGKGLASQHLDRAAFVRAAEICNTQVPIYQGATETKPLFTCNTIIDTSKPVRDNVNQLLKGMRGFLPIVNGKLTPVIELDDQPVAYGIEQKHIRKTLRYKESGKNKRYNRVIVEFVDAEVKFSKQQAVYPAADSDLFATWLAEDNDVLLEHRITVDTITDYYEARQMARVIAMLSRESLTVEVEVAPMALQYTIGDVIPLSHDKTGWQEKPFRLLNARMLSDGWYKLTLREHQPYIYNWLSGNVRPPIPDTKLPDPTVVSEPLNFSAEALDDGQIKIIWQSLYSLFEINLYKNNKRIAAYTSVLPEFVINSVDAGSYELDVRAISVLGFSSKWVTFAFDIATPAAPTVEIDSASYNTLSFKAVLAGASFGTVFEWQRLGKTGETPNPSTIAQGHIYTTTGLWPDTEYDFQVRAKNPAGVSAWHGFSAKTTVSDLLEHIEQIPLNKLDDAAQDLIADINQQVDRLRDDTPNNLPSLVVKNIDAITGLNKKVEVIDAESPNSLQKQIERSSDKISQLEDVTKILDESIAGSLPERIRLNKVEFDKTAVAVRDMQKTLFDVTSNYTAFRGEYERRIRNNERLIDAAVYVDPDTGTIVNHAFKYTNEQFTEAKGLIDGANARIAFESKRIKDTQDGLSEAKAELEIQAGRISQRATFTEVDAQIASAIAALTPAYSWQFNTSADGFTGDIAHNAQGFIVCTGSVTTPAIALNADENPMLRVRVRKHDAGTWLGRIHLPSGTINLPAPSGSDFEVLTFNAADVPSYTGTISSLVFELGDCDIDSIELGKRGANDLELQDINARTTELEQDIDAGTGRMAQYATTVWVNELGFQTQSNVQALIDSFNTQYSISAILQQLDENGTIERANAAALWVDGAAGKIRQEVTHLLNEDGGVNQKLATAQQEIDAVKGEINQSITQIQGVQLELKNKGLNEVMAAYNDLLRDQSLAEQNITLAHANSQLKALTDEVSAQAKQSTELLALHNQSAASLQQIGTAFSNEKTARAKSELALRAEIDKGTSKAVADAKQTLQAVVGYCVDADGNVTDELDAVACVAAGHTWQDGSLVQHINQYTAGYVSEQGYQTATQVGQIFDTRDGEIGITATIKALNDNGTIEQAKSAMQWVNAAEGTIENVITQFLNKPDGLNQSVAFAYDLIQANADELAAVTSQQLELSAKFENAQADFNQLNESFADEQSARAQSEQALRVQLQTGDTAMLATATEFTRALTGVCIDANGNRVDDYLDAVACEAAGHTWQDGPVVERALQLSAAEVDARGYQTQGDVNQLINAYDAVYGITATLQRFTDNDTLEKANSASRWIDGANATIRDRIVAFNAEDGSTNDKFASVDSELDAINGEINRNIVQIQGLNLGQSAQGLNDVIAAFNNFMAQGELAQQNVKAAIANDKLKAQTNDLESIAEQTLELAALYNEQRAQVQQYATAFANEKQANVTRSLQFAAFTEQTSGQFEQIQQTFADKDQALVDELKKLRAELETETGNAVAQANSYTRAAIGYCIDNEGNITNDTDAVACVKAGGSWVDGPLAEFVRNLSVTNADGKTASVGQLFQAFEQKDGQLIAKGGFVIDNNGRIASVAGYSNGNVSSIDMTADVIRQGVMVGNTFVPTSYVDNSDPLNPVHVFRGRLELGDYTVERLEDIRAQDGKDGANGKDGKDGAQGPQGIPGPKGEDGQPTYTWMRFADDINGNGISNNPNGKTFIGFAYRKLTPTESNNPADYIWGKFVGEDGKDGIPGEKGADGRQLFTWIGYSDFADGRYMYQTPTSTTAYIGIATNQYTATESHDHRLYTWARYRGHDGQRGPEGPIGPRGYRGYNGTNGAPGSRGAGNYTKSTADGVWNDAVAHSACPDLQAVDYDIVTIYKVSDPKVQTTKMWTGSQWEPFVLRVHGNALIEGTVVANEIVAGEGTINELTALNGAFTINSEGVTSVKMRVYNGSLLDPYNRFDVIDSALKVESNSNWGRGTLSVRNFAGTENRGYKHAVVADSDNGSAFYALGGGYAPFTGTHEGLIPKDVKLSVGDLVADVELVNISDYSNAICTMSPTTRKHQRTVRGVFISRIELDGMTPASMRGFKGWCEYLRYKDTHDLITFNALGEGVLNVCGENGNIKAGDFLVPSSMRGKAMRQASQTDCKPYTVAQARHDVTFKRDKQIKKVAVIYLRG